MSIERRKEFIDYFVSEMIFAVHKHHLKKEKTKEVEKEIEEELLREAAKQNKEIEEMKGMKLITRQFMPKIVPQKAEIPIQIQIPKQEIKIEEEETVKTGTVIDSLLSKGIKTIEGSSDGVRIKRDGEFEQTTIMLSENEIKDIIKKFSEITRIPITDNVLRTTINDFKITAIISNKIGSRFLIQNKKS